MNHSQHQPFDKRFDEVTEFKNRFGHCNVPQTCIENPALGVWCSQLRHSYNQLQKGLKPRRRYQNNALNAWRKSASSGKYSVRYSLTLTT